MEEQTETESGGAQPAWAASAREARGKRMGEGGRREAGEARLARLGM